MAKQYSLNLTSEQAAYLAGVIDSEGSICVLAQTHKDKRSSIQVRLNIGSTSVGLFLWLRKYLPGFGAFTFQSQSKRKAGKYKNGWNWLASTRQAEIIIKAIRPWLVTKTLQADHAIATIEMIAPHSSSYSQERQDRYNAAAEQARLLNARGVTEPGLETLESFKALMERTH